MYRKTAIILFSLTALLLISPLAGSAADMPTKLAKEFGLFPGAKVLDTTESPRILQAMLDCGSVAQQKVFAFYKKQAIESGWKIMAEKMAKGKRHLMLYKKPWNGNIAVGEKGGKTSATVSLMKSFTD